MLLKDKTGEKMLSFVWIFLWVIVGGAIVISVGMVYSEEVDVRSAEAESLNSNILDCIIEDGFLVENFGEHFDIFQECKISEKVFSENSFYFRIYFDGEEKMIEKGIFSKTDCELSLDNKIETKYYPKCVKVSRNVVYVKEGEIKKGVVEVLTASNQVGGKI